MLQKPRRGPKILRAGRVTWMVLHAQDPQTFGDTAQNFVGRTIHTIALYYIIFYIMALSYNGDVIW